MTNDCFSLPIAAIQKRDYRKLLSEDREHNFEIP